MGLGDSRRVARDYCGRGGGGARGRARRPRARATDLGPDARRHERGTCWKRDRDHRTCRGRSLRPRGCARGARRDGGRAAGAQDTRPRHASQARGGNGSGGGWCRAVCRSLARSGARGVLASAAGARRRTCAGASRGGSFERAAWRHRHGHHRGTSGDCRDPLDAGAGRAVAVDPGGARLGGSRGSTGGTARGRSLPPGHERCAAQRRSQDRRGAPRLSRRPRRDGPVPRLPGARRRIGPSRSRHDPRPGGNGNRHGRRRQRGARECGMDRSG